MTSAPPKDLPSIAKDAVTKFPNSDIQVAWYFVEEAAPHCLPISNDRLVKVGRKLVSLVKDHDPFLLKDGLDLLLQETELIHSGVVKVPKVPFGKTGLRMPIVTLGCMRFQQEWGPRITNMNQVGSDCQDNLVEILKTAIGYGITHIETARGYGCSELQLGVALQQLFRTGVCKREDLIIQTKVPANQDPVAFREALELSFKNLQIEYLDLFALHGMNYEEQYEWVFGGNHNCMNVIREYMAAGRIRHLGFSTHGSTDFIKKCIEMDVFEYVNLHYHYFGSYTASGGGHDGNGNFDNVKLLAEKNMGCFIISPFDKGGRVYAPSKKLRSLTLPDMEPMSFKSFWIWNHHKLEDGFPQLHTYTVGAARPSDLDQPATDAFLHHSQPDSVLSKIQATTRRLDIAKEKALGKDWVENWWKGLPKALDSKHQIEHNQLVWIYNSIKAFGLYDFGKNRYKSFEGNESKWDESKSLEENIENIGKNSWGFVPGRALQPGIDYSDDFTNVPAENLERVMEAERFVYQWCRTKESADDAQKDKPNPVRQNLIKRTFSAKRNALISEGDEEEISVPDEWETSYDMRPWPDYPDQPSRA